MTFYGNAVFIAGHDFDSEYGHHEVGSEVKEALHFGNLDALVSCGWLFPVVPEQGYGHLPPHLFSLVVTRQEAEAAINGDPSMRVSQQHPGGKPEEVVRAEQQAVEDEQARVIRQELAGKVNERQQNPPPPDDSPLDEQQEKEHETKRTVRKVAVKRTPQKKD